MKQKRKNKSIGQKMKKVQSYQKQKEILSQWSDDWEYDQNRTISQLKIAFMKQDYETVRIMIMNLEAISEKKFTALNNIIDKISDPDRKLKDIRQDNETHEVNKQMDTLLEQEEIITEITETYERGVSLREISDLTGYTHNKVRKILITSGVYVNDRYSDIQRMRDQGMSENQIALKLGIRIETIQEYTPYTKGDV